MASVSNSLAQKTRVMFRYAVISWDRASEHHMISPDVRRVTASQNVAMTMIKSSHTENLGNITWKTIYFFEEHMDNNLDNTFRKEY